MKIRRRVNKGTMEVVENVELIKKRDSSVAVRLSNGDIIRRKLKDIVE